MLEISSKSLMCWYKLFLKCHSLFLKQFYWLYWFFFFCQIFIESKTYSGWLIQYGYSFNTISLITSWKIMLNFAYDDFRNRLAYDFKENKVCMAFRLKVDSDTCLDLIQNYTQLSSAVICWTGQLITRLDTVLLFTLRYLPVSPLLNNNHLLSNFFK